jgi:DNA invertase Pin-like site-specific DNA recombinase
MTTAVIQQEESKTDWVEGTTTDSITNRAVLYLRVSTPGQVHTDYDPEGISLPAQRKACERKAKQLGLKIVGEYVEAGVSGRGTEHRMEFQKMLARIKTNKDVDYVIVHKLSRLARNRIDEALIMDQFNRRNVTLVSATEPIDNTPEGQFMQGILSAMAQFRSQQDGEDIAYKMGEKAKNGGTIGKAPIGYLNTRETVDGHQVSTVKPDPVRAPFIRTAFEMYRDGATVKHICRELAIRGFLTQPRRNHPASPITDGAMCSLLRDPYYMGFITYKGELYPGRHQPLISQELFDQVQSILSSHGKTGERVRIHDHYLKGLLWCGPCHEQGLERRMILNKTHGKGRTFDMNPHEHAPYIQTKLIENAVARYYHNISFSPAFISAMQQALETTVGELHESDTLAQKQAQQQADKLKVEEERLVQLALDGTISDDDIVSSKLNQIRVNLVAAQKKVDSITSSVEQGAKNITEILRFLENPAAWYNHPLAGNDAKKQLNIAIFKKIYIYYDVDTRQAQIDNVQYADDIATLKDIEQHYKQTGKLGLEQAADRSEDNNPPENQSNSAKVTSTMFTRTSTDTLQNTFTNTQNSVDTLDRFTRTSDTKQPENADLTTKSAINQEQNPPQSACDINLNQVAISPQNPEITGVDAPSEHKNPSIGKTDATGSSNNPMVDASGREERY